MRPALLALGLLAAVLVGTLTVELRPADDAPAFAAGTPRAGDTGPRPDTRTADDQTPAWVATILGRPLFNPSRRPPTTAAARAAGITELPRLSAVLISDAGKRVIFAATGGGHPIVAQEGSHIGEFTVQSITAGAVTVLGPGGPRILHPTFSTTTAPGGATRGPSAGLAAAADMSALLASSAQSPK